MAKKAKSAAKAVRTTKANRGISRRASKVAPADQPARPVKKTNRAKKKRKPKVTAAGTVLTVTPNTFDQLLKEVADYKSLYARDRDEILFRGQDNDWPLLPSLFRPRDPSSDFETWEIESDLFFEFKSQASALYGQGLSDWDVLFYMQHHRVPTRLLDWTNILGVALYFVALGANLKEEAKPCIWMLNPYLLNSNFEAKDLSADTPESEEYRNCDYWDPKYLGWDEDKDCYYEYGDLLVEDDGIDWNAPLAIFPSRRNPRMIAQRGLFTIHGTDERPLDQIAPYCLKKVVVRRELLGAVTEFVRHAGFNDANVWADIDGLARDLRMTHGYDPHPLRWGPKKG